MRTIKENPKSNFFLAFNFLAVNSFLMKIGIYPSFGTLYIYNKTENPYKLLFEVMSAT
jgi:hypothetical protein